MTYGSTVYITTFVARGAWPPEVLRHHLDYIEGDHLTDGEQHIHEETQTDEHTNEDGTVTQTTTEKTEADTNDGDE